MNLLIGLVVVVCLVVCEVDSQSPAEDVWMRVAAMLLLAFSVPGLAVFQTLFLCKRSKLAELPVEQKEQTLKRLAVCHSAVWLIASLMIVWAVQWQTVVRSNWGLDQWPLLDEALILFPIILSMVASWAIFYDVQRSLNGRLEPQLRKPRTFYGSILDSKRMAFVAVRFRIYFVMSLLPVSVLVGLRDIERLTESSPTALAFVYLTTTALVLIGFPFILGLIWNVRPAENRQLSNELDEFCKQHRLRVTGIRVWHTDNQISNAMVVGFVPWFRSIIITDGMLHQFPKREMFAILRHEAGHIRLWHLPIRVGFVLLPLLVLAVAEQLGLSAMTNLNYALNSIGITGQPEWLAMSIVYVAYLIPALSWLSRKMEFEADLYAINGDAGIETLHSDLRRKNANDLLDALLRFASHFPQQLDRKTMMHPSLRQRMRRIATVRDDPESLKLTRLTPGKQPIFFLLVVASAGLATMIL